MLLLKKYGLDADDLSNFRPVKRLAHFQVTQAIGKEVNNHLDVTGTILHVQSVYRS